MTIVSQIKHWLDRVLETTLLIVIVTLVFIVLWQVFSRYVLQSPSTFTDEVARFLLIWLSILGAAWVFGQRAHLAIDLLPEKMAEKGIFALHRLIFFLIVFFAVGVMVGGGLNLVYITLTLEQQSTVLQVPMGIVYLALPISGLCISIYGCCHLLTPNELLSRDD